MGKAVHQNQASFPPDAIATAMESINTLAVWLVDAGLDECSYNQEQLSLFCQSRKITLKAKASEVSHVKI